MQRRVAPIRRPRPDWSDVEVFLALLRAPSLTAAAKALGLDKSTVSRRLESLEKSLGARLFLRTREGLRPSPVGEKLRSHAEAMEAAARSLESGAVSGGDEVTGLVRVATTDAMGPRLVEQGLLDLCAQYPSLRIEILSGNRPIDLERGEADLAVRVTRPAQASLQVRVLARLGFALYASPSYLRSRGLPRSASQLEGHDVLVPSGDLSHIPEGKWLASRPGVRAVLQSSSMPVLVAAAARGHGLVALTTAWGDAHPGLERAMELPNIPARPLWLVMPPDAAERAAVRVVADRIAEQLRAAARR